MATLKSNPFYKGNEFLPKAGTVKELTPEFQKEIERCIEDPIYFAEKYFKIVHQDSDEGIIDLKLFPYQKQAISELVRTRRLLMATARQVGKTTVATVIILWIALFNKRKNIALLADKQDTATEVLERIKIAYEYLPDFLKGGVRKWDQKTVIFENGSKIMAAATGSNTIRGKSIFLLYIDEAAHVEDWENFNSAVMPTVTAAKKSYIVLTSTPNGMNHFYDYYEAAKKKISEYPLIEVPWWEVEGRDEAWKQKTLADMNYNTQKFAQEHEVEFLGSSGTLISGAALKILQDGIVKPIQQEDGLRMYESVKHNHQYVLIADVSRGKKIDYSAFHVIDITNAPYRQVCTYYNNEKSSSDYAAIIDRIGRYYNYCPLLIENNDNGGAVLDVLFLVFEYENILMTQSKGVGAKEISVSAKADKGVRTTAPIKLAGCAMLKSLAEQKQLIIVDSNTVEELKTFSAKGNSYEAEQGKHDDLVMGLVLFGWLSKLDYFRHLTDADTLKALREQSDEELEEYLLPFGIVNSGIDPLMNDDIYPMDVNVSSNEFDSWMTH